MPVASSWKDIDILYNSTKNNIRTIAEHNTTLEQQLNSLGTSFKDEGINIIQDHINKTKKQIEDTVPEFEIVLKKIFEYARLLESSESAINR